jgi:hypothetical protein
MIPWYTKSQYTTIKADGSYVVTLDCLPPNTTRDREAKIYLHPQVHM